MLQKEKVLILLALASGAANTLCFTLQNKQEIIQHEVHKRFFHPYMQAAMRFFSNSLIIVVALATKRNFREHSRHKLNPLCFLWAALMDVLFSFCYYTALNFIPNSVYQMLRGGTLIFTYLFTLVILKVSISRQKVMGCGVIVAGLAVVGVTNLVLGSRASNEQMVGAGYGLIVVGIILSGLHFVYQQYLILKFGVDPLWLLGIQSLVSMAICGLVIPFLSYISCPFKQSACVIDSDGNAVVQNVHTYFSDILSSGMILLGVGLLLLSMVTFNGVGLLIVKKMSSLVRAVIDVSRTVLIWLAGLVVTATAGAGNKTYQWQSLEWQTVLAESAGFLLLIFGNLVYYQLITFKCLASPPQQQTQSLLQQQQESAFVAQQESAFVGQQEGDFIATKRK